MFASFKEDFPGSQRYSRAAREKHRDAGSNDANRRPEPVHLTPLR
jgi:hypothetical protein